MKKTYYEESRKVLNLIHRIILAVLLPLVPYAVYAQDKGEIERYEFETDRSGNIVRKIPVFKDTSVKNNEAKSAFLGVSQKDGVTVVRVKVSDKLWGSTGTCVLRIYASSGEVVAAYRITEKVSSVTLNSLESGVFIANLFDGNKLLESKTFVNRHART